MLWWWTGSAQLDACIALCLAAPARTPHGPKGGPATLIAHVDSHLAGTLRGHVPQQWLTDNNRQRCMVCGFQRLCPVWCPPAARAAFSGSDAGRAAAAPTLPSLGELQSAHASCGDRLWVGFADCSVCAVSTTSGWPAPQTRSSCLHCGPFAPLGRGERHSLWDDAGRPPGGPKPRLSDAKKRALTGKRAMPSCRMGFVLKQPTLWQPSVLSAQTALGPCLLDLG